MLSTQSSRNDKKEMEGQEEQCENSPTKKQKLDKPKVYDSMLWKILKGKYMISMYLCADDWRKLFENREKVQRSADDRVRVSFDMCEECARVNCRMN
ncbi:hypothetical protein niasHT_031555 [Heterodera trifolii]|uniref:Uncharacterized protein n=1 Tax=Heterodera trifolii TaxID=157864 RepID=A0ABD2J3M5_9BILA